MKKSIVLCVGYLCVVLMHLNAAVEIDYSDIIRNDTRKIKEAILKGADVNVKNKFGITPLMCAAQYDALKIAKLLIKSGAKINDRNMYHITALMAAAMNNSARVAELLLEKGAPPEAKSVEGRTALMFAAMKNSRDVAKVLIKKKADINTFDINNNTPASIATENGFKELLDLFELNETKVEKKKSGVTTADALA